MVRVVSHSYVLITLKEDMHGDIGQKEVRYLHRHVKQNLSHKGETLLSNEAQWKKYNVCK